MDRLTARDEKTGNAYFPQCFDICDGVCMECECETSYVETLAAYEDTGYTPGQIRGFDKLYLEKCQEVNELRKRMQWIPVKERLPEEGENVIVWYEYFRYGEYYRMYQTYGIGYQFGGHWSGDVQGTRARCIAWQPLPEPYKPKKPQESPCNDAG